MPEVLRSQSKVIQIQKTSLKDLGTRTPYTNEEQRHKKVSNDIRNQNVQMQKLEIYYSFEGGEQDMLSNFKISAKILKYNLKIFSYASSSTPNSCQ